MLSNIPKMRLLTYLIIISLVPALIVIIGLWQRSGELTSLDQRIEQIREKMVLRAARQAQNAAVMAYYRHADNFYIDKQLEKMHFLQPEVKALKNILQNKQFADNEELRRRLEYLSGPSNTLTYNEGAVVRYPTFKEVIETQTHPIEVDIDDIEHLLTLIEGVPLGGFEVPPGRPQLIILDMRLDKKKISEDNEVFLLNSRLLKREYL